MLVVDPDPEPAESGELLEVVVGTGAVDSVESVVCRRLKCCKSLFLLILRLRRAGARCILLLMSNTK